MCNMEKAMYMYYYLYYTQYNNIKHFLCLDSTKTVIQRELRQSVFCNEWIMTLNLYLFLKGGNQTRPARSLMQIIISSTDRYQPCKICISPGGWYMYCKVSCIANANPLYLWLSYIPCKVVNVCNVQNI